MSRILFSYSISRLLALYLFFFLSLISVHPSTAEEGPVIEKGVKGVISGVIIDPPSAISIDELKSLVDIKEGAPLSRKVLREGLKLLYLKGGFSDISVDSEEAGGKIRLSFRFVLSERVGKIFFSGNQDISGRYLEDLLTISDGDELNLKLVERQVTSIKEFYLKKGYFQCETGYLLKRPPEGRDVDIEYIIREGKRASVAKIDFKWNKAFSGEKLMKKVSLKVGDMYEDKNISAAAKQIERYYRGNGYTEARAGFQYDYIPDVNGVRVTFNIEEGEVKGKDVRVAKISFKGNVSIPSKILRKQMLTGRVFSDETFATDMEAVEFLYRKSGYLSARVLEKGMAYNEDGTKVKIELTIHEGPQTIIRGMEFEGNSILSREELLAKNVLKTGAPLDPWLLDESLIKISSLYFEKGYIYARVSYKEEFTADKSGVIIRYRLDEGLPVKIRKIVIRGNDFTADKVIRRELIVGPGDTYNPEAVFKSQQRVSRLGYLSNVRLTPVDEDVVEGEKDLVLTVRERKAGAFEFGAGYGTEEKFRGFAELSHRNLYGTGASARLRGDVSQIESSYLLGFKKPWLFDFPVDGRVSLVDQMTKRESYSLEKYAAIIGIDKDLTEYIKGSLQYEFEISRLFDVEGGAKIAPEDEGTIDIGTISPIIIRDSRDNPFNPRSGSVNSLKLDHSAGMATGSEIEFVRYIIQSSWYIPLSKKVVWGLSARGGWADAYGKTEEIPLSKRFFLGGRTTVRGFKLDSIGPKGADGSPTGGDAYLNLNTELRFPLYKSFGGLLFVDAGNVWLKNQESVNVTDLRSSAGIGLRYLTPVGPLSLDAGWKLDMEKGESPWEWHFTIGNLF